jgi:hypothetical protein
VVLAVSTAASAGNYLEIRELHDGYERGRPVAGRPAVLSLAGKD